MLNCVPSLFYAWIPKGNRMNDELVPVFMPALSALLLQAEDLKGSPLTPDEVMAIRDNANCAMTKHTVAEELNHSRGYVDIDPENCWYEWQYLRRELGRKPDLDPGPLSKSGAGSRHSATRAC